MKENEILGTQARVPDSGAQEQKAQRSGVEPLFHRPQRARGPHLLRPALLRRGVLLRDTQFHKP